jgi:hypothetical protein
MSIINSSKDVYNDDLTQRSKWCNPFYKLAATARQVVAFPLTICTTISGKVAEKAINAVSSACSTTPSILRRPYDNYCNRQAEKYLDRVVSVLPVLPAIPQVQSSWFGGLAGYAKSALSWVKPVVSLGKHFDPSLASVERNLNSADDILHGRTKKVIAERCIAPILQTAHKKVAEEVSKAVLGFALNWYLQDKLFTFVNAHAASCVSTHANADMALMGVEYGSLAYMYVPTAYKCFKVMRNLYDLNIQANQMKAYLNTSRVKRIADEIAARLSLPAGGSDSIIKIASIVLCETGMAYLTPFIDRPEVLFEAIGNCLSQII